MTDVNNVENEAPEVEVVDAMPVQEDQSETIRELQEQVKRTAAEFENFRRRQEGEQKRRLVMMKEDLFRKLLPVIDNLDRTVEASKTTSSLEALLKGVELIRRDLGRLLTENEIEAIEAVGAAFDASFHEAMMTEERSDVPDQSIVAELQKGYKMGDRVLRPAMVKVSIAPAPQVANATEAN